jgi:hypothetical protein
MSSMRSAKALCFSAHSYLASTYLRSAKVLFSSDVTSPWQLQPPALSPRRYSLTWLSPQLHSGCASWLFKQASVILIRQSAALLSSIARKRESISMSKPRSGTLCVPLAVSLVLNAAQIAQYQT